MIEPRHDSRAAFVMRGVLHVYVFFLVLALYPYTHNPAGPVKQLATDAAVFLMGVAWLAGVCAAGERMRLRSPLTLLLGAFVGLHLVATLASAHVGYGAVEMQRWAGLFLLYLYTAHAVRDAEQFWTLIRSIILAVAVSSLYGLYQATGWWDPFPWSERAIEEYRGLPSTYANPNFAAHALVMALVLAAGSLWRRPWLLAPAALMLIHVYGTQSRGARISLLAAAALVVIVLVVRSRFERPVPVAARSLAYFALTGIGVAVLVMAGQAVARETLFPVDSSLVLRYNGYHGAAKMIGDRPVLGFGPGTYPLVNDAYWTDYEQQWYAATGRKNFHVHNDLLETAVDAGFPAAVMYLAILVWALLRSLSLVTDTARERRRLGLTLAACFTAFTVDGLFGFNLRVPVSSGLFFMLLGGLDAVAGGREGGSGKREEGSRIASLLGSAGAAVIALVSLVFGGRFFHGEQCLQRAEIARYYYENSRKDGNQTVTSQYLDTAYRYLALGQRMMPWDVRFPLYAAYLDTRAQAYGNVLKHLAYAESADCVDVQAISRLARAYTMLALESLDGSPVEAARLANAARGLLDRVERLCAPLPELWELRANVGMVAARLAERKGQDARMYWHDVAEHLNRALVLGTRNRGAIQRVLATTLIAIGDMAAAERAFLQAAESAPESPDVWHAFHGMAREQNRFDPLVASLRNARDRLLRRSPVPVEACSVVSWHLAVVHRERGEPELAREVLEDAIQRDPADLTLWGEWMTVLPGDTRLSLLARAAREQSDRAEKAGKPLPAELRLVSELESANTETLGVCARRLRELTVPEAGPIPPEEVMRRQSWIADLCVDALKKSPLPREELGGFLAALGEVFLRAGRWDSADQTLGAASNYLSDRERALVLANRSEALAQLGNPAEALALATEAARVARDSMIVGRMLARRLAENGRAAEARVEYRALIERLPRNSTAHRELAAELDKLNGKVPSAEPESAS